MIFRPISSAIAAACVIAMTGVFAQPVPATPPAAPTGPRQAGAQQELTGRVQQWLINPNGEVDGLLLADGTQVGFPPHLSPALTAEVKLRDTVKVSGWRSGSGATMRAASIRNVASGRVVVDSPPDAAGPRPMPPSASALTALTANGRIRRVLYGPMGEANGAIVDDGTIVRFPPHVGAGLGDTLKPGGTLYARGYGTRNGFGAALEATTIGPTADTARDTFAPPRGERRMARRGPHGMMPPPPDAAAPAVAPEAPPEASPRAMPPTDR